MPGTLPTLKKGCRLRDSDGHALIASVNRVCKQDRKTIFTPICPKAYQISQFDIPCAKWLCGRRA
jgi:aspartyl-tRNA(Asn)/glutamyl-tRNA(Gln) amidotransferase subunit B